MICNFNKTDKKFHHARIVRIAREKLEDEENDGAITSANETIKPKNKQAGGVYN